MTSTSIILVTSCAIPLPCKGENFNQKRLLQYVYIFNYYSQFYIVSNCDSLNSAFAEVVPITPGVESFRDCWTQHLVERVFSNPSEFQSVVDCWSRRQWERAKTYNSVFNTSCSTVKPYPQIILELLEGNDEP